MATPRLQTKKDNSFLVQFLCDKQFMVRSRGLIGAEGEIHVGDIYIVQWGRPSEKDEAKICGSGTEVEMRALLKEKQDELRHKPPCPKKPRVQRVKRPNGKPAAVVIRRTKLRVQQADPSRPVDNEPIQPQEDTQAQETAAQGTPAQNETPAQDSTLLEGNRAQETPDQEISAQAESKTRNETPTQEDSSAEEGHQADEPTRQGTPQQETQLDPIFDFDDDDELIQPLQPLTRPRSSTLRIVRPSSTAAPNQFALQCQLNSIGAKLDAQTTELEKLRRQGEARAKTIQQLVEGQNKLITMVETLLARQTQQRSQAQPLLIEDSFLQEDISCFEEEFGLAEEEILRIARESHNAGHFAAKMTTRLYPELFGLSQLRFNFNYYGGGPQQKTELSPRRKQVLQRCVCRMYPEMRDQTRWKEGVVSKVNEILRRPTKKKIASGLHQRPECYDTDTELYYGHSYQSYMNL